MFRRAFLSLLRFLPLERVTSTRLGVATQNEHKHQIFHHSIKLESASQQTLTMARKRKTSKKSFLDLPAEIRNTIYEMALVKDRLVEGSLVDITYRNYHVKVPALLQTNRQIRSETLPIFYGANTFRCSRWRSARLFLRSLGEDKLRALRRVYCSMGMEISLAPAEWEWTFDGKKANLARLRETFRGYGLRMDALLMPINVHGEDHSRWVTFDEMVKYEVREREDGGRILVRK